MQYKYKRKKIKGLFLLNRTETFSINPQIILSKIERILIK